MEQSLPYVRLGAADADFPCKGREPTVHTTPQASSPTPFLAKTGYALRTLLPALVLLALSAAVQLKGPEILEDISRLLSAAHLSRPGTAFVAEAAWNESLAQCREAWGPLPGPSKDFASRTGSDRFVEGTPDVVVRNATIWTGSDNGKHIVRGDVWLSGGIIKAVGSLSDESLAKNTKEVHAAGAWVTPGIFDMHSHIGDDALPSLSGAADTNSRQKPILPYLRSLDAFNTHDLMFARARSGGVTTSLVLPGSANNIGGQAFLFKLRDTKEKTPASMMLEPPFTLPFAARDRKKGDPPRWRHMKNACGENIRRVYKQTRMDLAWNFRSAFEEARLVKQAQDAYCEKAFAADKAGKTLSETFPESFEWEALVDVLRGKVKVNTHCYEATDLQAYVDHTLEFKYPLAAFHHAHEAYLVPGLLNQTYGGPPAAAIFATNGRYKREAWRGSEYAPLVLSQNGIKVVMKSDHPVLNSQYLIFEAQQAHHFGLPEHLALASIFSTPAEVQGIDHRIGFVRAGHDADIVLWDSHPLTLGATPTQVFIDGIAQLPDPFVVPKPDLQKPPFIADAIVPDIASHPPSPTPEVRDVLFTNVSRIYDRGAEGIEVAAEGVLSVGVSKGKVACIGDCASFASSAASLSTLDLAAGTLAPGFLGFGPALGLADLISEDSTQDGPVFDPLEVETKLGSLQKTTVRAIDGLQLDGKHLRYATRFGVTKAVTAPMGYGVFRGVSVAFRTGAKNSLEKGAIVKTDAALHVTIGHDSSAPPSISTQIGVLRRLLIGSVGATSVEKLLFNATSIFPRPFDEPDYFAMCAYGMIPLVVNVWKADHMATLIHLKDEVESAVALTVAQVSSYLQTTVQPPRLRMVFHGGQESHLVAKEIAAAEIGVIVSPPRPLPESWDERRAPPSIPLGEAPLPVLLERAGVQVGLGVPEEWEVIQLGWEAGWAIRDSGARRAGEKTVEKAPLGKEVGIKWLTTNLEEMLGLDPAKERMAVGTCNADFVAWRGDPLDFGSQVVAIIEDGQVKLF